MYLFKNVNYGRNVNNVIPGAPNFKYGEVVSSLTAVRNNVLNIPSEQEWRNAELTAVNVMQPIRNKFGPIRINSWYRGISLNTHPAIGGSPTSNHCRGEAVDFEPYDKNVKLIDILDWIVNESNLSYHELIAEYFPDGWIHIAFRQGSERKLLKLKDKYHNYARVNIDYIKSLYK